MAGHADAVLAASIFHYGEHTVQRSQALHGRARHPDAAGSERSRQQVAEQGALGRERPGAGDRAGSGDQRRADVRLDEPRRAGADGGTAARPSTGAARARSCGTRARSPATSRRCCEIRLDCDEDVVLLKVEQVGGIACHTGRHSCFFQKFDSAAEGDWQAVDPVLQDPDTHLHQRRNHHERYPGPRGGRDRVAQAGQRRRPGSLVCGRLFAKGDDAILKKIGEEATETVMAAKDARVDGDASQGAVRMRRPVVPFAGAAGAVRPDAAAGARRAGAARRRVRHRRESRAQAEPARCACEPAH